MGMVGGTMDRSMSANALPKGVLSLINIASAAARSFSVVQEEALVVEEELEEEVMGRGSE